MLLLEWSGANAQLEDQVRKQARALILAADSGNFSSALLAFKKKIAQNDRKYIGEWFSGIGNITTIIGIYKGNIADGQSSIHESFVTLNDGRTIPLKLANNRIFATPGLSMPVAGLILNGSLLMDESELHECALATHGRWNCSVAGIWRLFSNQEKAAQLAERMQTTGHVNLRKLHGLPILHDQTDMLFARGNHAHESGVCNMVLHEKREKDHKHLKKHPRSLQIGVKMPQLPPTWTIGYRSMFAFRMYYTDQTASSAITWENFNYFLNYLVETHGARSFGRLQWNITLANCTYRYQSLNRSAAGSVSTDALRTSGIAAIQAASSSSCQINTTGYDHYAIFLPETSSFSWAGKGSLGGNWVWLNGQSSNVASVLAHEVGHNFGIHHANSLVFSSTSGSLTSKEYGDDSDIMGGNNNMVTGDFNSGFKHLMDWISNDWTAQIDPILHSSALFLLAASDRNHTPGQVPQNVPSGVVFSARAIVPTRTAYSTKGNPMFLYLTYRSSGSTGNNGVSINEVPVSLSNNVYDVVGQTFIVCPRDVSCTEQVPLSTNDAFVYDVAGARILIELGSKFLVFPGNSSPNGSSGNTTDQDSAIYTRMAYLDATGSPLNPSFAIAGCNNDGCVPSRTQIDASIKNLTCGSVRINLDSVNQVRVFQLSPSLTSSSVLLTTCPLSGPLSKNSTGISVFVGGFPTSHAYYGGNVGNSGDAFSQTTYNSTGSTTDCASVALVVPSGLTTWVVIGSPGENRGSTVSFNLTVNCNNSVQQSWFPRVFLPSSQCSSSAAGWFYVMPGVFVNKAPVWKSKSGFFLKFDGNRYWIVADNINSVLYYCRVLGTTYSSIVPGFGVCPAGSYKSSGSCLACPFGRFAPVGSTSALDCVCPDEYIVDSAGNCRGPSIGGPINQRSNWTGIVRKPETWFVTPTKNVAVNCPVADPSQCVTYKYYQTIYMSAGSTYDGWYSQVANNTCKGLPVYQSSTKLAYLMSCDGITSSCWYVAKSACAATTTAYDYLDTPLTGQPPQFLSASNSASGSSYALCDAADVRAIDFNGNRLCYCPGGSSPDAITGICNACPLGTFRSLLPALPVNDTCKRCSYDSFTSSIGMSECDISFCTAFNVSTRFDSTSSCTSTLRYSGCSNAVKELQGTYWLRSAIVKGVRNSYVRTDSTMFLHDLSGTWTFDKDLNASNGYWYTYTGIDSSSWSVLPPKSLYWDYKDVITGIGSWWLDNLITNSTCVACGLGAYGSPVGGVPSGCKQCPTGTTSNFTARDMTTTISSCNLCLPGYGSNGSTCIPCSSTSYNDAPGRISCQQCGLNAWSTPSAGVACTCRTGYIRANNGSCVDLDECAAGISGCTDTCTNYVGGYKCSCPPGQVLEIDRVTCVSCGSAFMSNGTSCLPCPLFTTSKSGIGPCTCNGMHVMDINFGVCTPASDIMLDGSSIGAINASLTLTRLQYVNVRVPAAESGNMVITMPSPVYEMMGGAVGGFLAFTDSVLPTGESKAGWRLSTDVSVRSRDLSSVTQLEAITPTGARGTFAYSFTNEHVLPDNGTVTWTCYQARPFRLFVTAPAAGLKRSSELKAGQPFLLTPMPNFTPAVNLALVVSGLVGSGSRVRFFLYQSTSTPCLGVPASFFDGTGKGDGIVDQDLRIVNLSFPNATGKFELCIELILGLNVPIYNSSRMPVIVTFEAELPTSIIATGTYTATASSTLTSTSTGTSVTLSTTTDTTATPSLSTTSSKSQTSSNTPSPTISFSFSSTISESSSLFNSATPTISVTTSKSKSSSVTSSISYSVTPSATITPTTSTEISTLSISPNSSSSNPIISTTSSATSSIAASITPTISVSGSPSISNSAASVTRAASFTTAASTRPGVDKQSPVSSLSDNQLTFSFKITCLIGQPSCQLNVSSVTSQNVIQSIKRTFARALGVSLKAVFIRCVTIRRTGYRECFLTTNSINQRLRLLQETDEDGVIIDMGIDLKSDTLPDAATIAGYKQTLTQTTPTLLGDIIQEVALSAGIPTSALTGSVDTVSIITSLSQTQYQTNGSGDSSRLSSSGIAGVVIAIIFILGGAATYIWRIRFQQKQALQSPEQKRSLEIAAFEATNPLFTQSFSNNNKTTTTITTTLDLTNSLQEQTSITKTNGEIHDSAVN